MVGIAPELVKAVRSGNRRSFGSPWWRVAGLRGELRAETNRRIQGEGSYDNKRRNRISPGYTEIKTVSDGGKKRPWCVER